MKTEKDFRNLTESIQDLPTLPGVVIKLNTMIRDPKTSAQQIGDLISNDQVLAAKALKLVNSAFYGFPRKITNITHAIVILGFQKVRDIVLTASIFDMFKNKSMKDFDISTFWEHTLTTAIASEAIARAMNSHEVPDSFIAGLLHDLGKVIIALYAELNFISVIQVKKEKNITMYEAEMEVLGYSHGDVGSWLTEKWQFPDKIVRTMRLHHAPEAARESRELNSIVHLADIMAHSIAMTAVDSPISVVDQDVWDEFRLNKKTLDSFYLKIGEGLDKAKDFFALIPKE